MDCDELYSKLVGGFPNLQSYCRQDGHSTAEMVDVSFGDLVVGLHEQDLVPKLRGCCLESKRDGDQLSQLTASRGHKLQFFERIWWIVFTASIGAALVYMRTMG